MAAVDLAAGGNGGPTRPRTSRRGVLRLLSLFWISNPAGNWLGKPGTRQPSAGRRRHLDQQSIHLCAAVLVQLPPRRHDPRGRRWLAGAQQSQSRAARHGGVGCDEPAFAWLQPDWNSVWWPELVAHPSLPATQKNWQPQPSSSRARPKLTPSVRSQAFITDEIHVPRGSQSSS